MNCLRLQLRSLNFIKIYSKSGTVFLSYKIMAISATIDTAAAVADDDVVYI